MYRTYRPDLPFPRQPSQLTLRGRKTELRLPVQIRGFRPPGKKTKIISISQPQKEKELPIKDNHQKSPLKSRDILSTINLQSEPPLTQRSMSYSRAIISLTSRPEIKEEMKLQDFKQFWFKPTEPIQSCRVIEQRENCNVIWSSRGARTRSTSVASVKPKLDDFKSVGTKVELAKLPTSKHSKSSALLHDGATHQTIQKPFSNLEALDKGKANSPAKIIRTKSINPPFTSFDNTHYQEFPDVGVYKYAGIHKGSSGTPQLTFRDISKGSPMVSARNRRRSLAKEDIPDGQMRIGLENIRFSAHRVNLEDKAFESLLENREESLNEGRNLHNGVADKVIERPLHEGNAKFFSRQSPMMNTYLFNKVKMMGSEDLVNWGNKKEITGKYNTHFLLSDLLKMKNMQKIREGNFKKFGGAGDEEA